MVFTRNLDEINSNDVAIAGGKGASLGEMIKAGISVPAGFVVLAGTFEKFLDDAHIEEEIDNILKSVDIQKNNSVEDTSEKIQALILNAKISDEIKSSILQSFDLLNTQYVAVRSSATAEDSASNAWAGQLDSYLNTDKETLLTNVKKCWASLFTPRAIFYRFENNLNTHKISVAVVVQKMIESEVSGIAFSVHPVTQDKNQIIIEAGFGLGEAIVSGQITPDSYVVEKKSRTILSKSIQNQSKALFRKATGGNEWIDLDDSKGGKQKLNDT